MNLSQSIARREKALDRSNTISGCLVVLFLVEALFAAATWKSSGFITALTTMGSVFVLTLIAAGINALWQRLAVRNDELILLEIKRRLERPLLELFKLEFAGQAKYVEEFLNWRDDYLAKCEETYKLTLPINLWIGTVKRGELPLAGSYRHKYGQNAILVEMAMHTALID